MPNARGASSPKLLYVANWDWVLYNFRLDLARSAAEAGYDVALVCPDGQYVSEFQTAGLRWIRWPLDRKSINPVTELISILRLAQIYEREQPDLIHHDTIKPNIYGALATWLNGVREVWRSPPQLLNSFMGVGFMFSNRPLARLLRPLVLPIMRFGMRREQVLTTFSNRRDHDLFVGRGLVEPERARVVVSEFVDTNRFDVPDRRNGTGPDARNAERPLRVLMAARLLWDKGVGEFVEAARILADRDVPVEFLLAGEPDVEAKGYVPVERLEQWDEYGPVRWLGYCSDMPALLREVDIAVLPTHYNEGLPRFLVEAASSGLPLVASDHAACRRVVEDGANGFVIPKEDAEQLARAVEFLARNSERRHKMGKASREKAVSKFDRVKNIEEWLGLYDQLVGDPTR